MKFWVYDKARRDAAGPFEVADLKKIPGFGPDTVVAPDGAASAQAWKPVSAYPELKALLRPTPPPLPPKVIAAAPTLAPTPTSLVSCPSCGKGLAETALTCPACGRIAAGLVGKYGKGQIGLIGSGLILLFIGVGMAPMGAVGLLCVVVFGGLGIVLIFAGAVLSLFRKRGSTGAAN